MAGHRTLSVTPAEARAWGRGDTRRVATRDFPAAVLALVDERQGGRACAACRAAGLQTPGDQPLEVDHLQPLARGGDNAWTNLQWLCRDHNRGKSARPSPPSTPLWARGQPGSQKR